MVCPERGDQITHHASKGSRGGRPTFDADLYKQRNVVKRCFNRLKQFRDLTTRYAKRTAYYQAELTIAAIVLWLRWFTGHFLGGVRSTAWATAGVSNSASVSS